MRVLRSGAVVAAVVLTLGLGACSSSSKKASGTTTTTVAGSGAATTTVASSSANITTIDIHNFMFKPTPAHVKAGTTVTVTNQDGQDHSLTADNGSFDTGVFSSGSKTITIAKPGTYTIHCRIHNFMTGTIIAS